MLATFYRVWGRLRFKQVQKWEVEVVRWEGDLQDQKRALEAQAQQAANMQQEAAAKHSQLEVLTHRSVF